MLEERYQIEPVNIVRNIRTLIEVGHSNHPDTEVSRYVYQGRNHLISSECLYLVVEYIKQKENKSSLTVNDLLFENDLEQKITNLLHQLGIVNTVNGYQYLMEAILYLVNADTPVYCSEIYKLIATSHAKSIGSVTRAVQHAISKSIDQFGEMTPIELMRNQTPDIVQFIYKHATNLSNLEFLNLFVNYLKNSEQEKNPQEFSITTVAISGRAKRRVRIKDKN